MRALFPATFDPFTNGHLDMAERASRLFETLVIAVYDRPAGKRPLFSLEERVAMVRASTVHLDNVSIDPFTGLTVECARRFGAGVIVRGLRSGADFDAELPMVNANHEMEPAVDVMFLVSRSEWSFVSSSLMKEIASLGGDVSRFVPPPVAEALRVREW